MLYPLLSLPDEGIRIIFHNSHTSIALLQ